MRKGLQVSGGRLPVSRERAVAAMFSAVVLSFAASSVFGQASEPPAPVTATPTVYENAPLVQRYQATITPEDLASQIYYFSSDYFEGRETATRGQKFAAEYLASQYRKLGLEPKGTVPTTHPYDPRAYFQPFSVYGTRMSEARLDVVVQNDTVAKSVFSANRQDHLAYLLYGSRPDASGGVVFAGYGISDPALEYDDYLSIKDKGMSIAGKWLLLLGDEPLKNDSTSLLPTATGDVSVWSRSVYQKLRAAYSHAVPKGFLIVGDASPRQTESLGKRAFLAAKGLDRGGRLSILPSGSPSPPVYVISSKLANQILAPSGRTIEELQRRIDTTLTPTVFELPGVSVTSRLKLETYTAKTENVLAYLEGSDPDLRDETLVISAHYDHIGIDPTVSGDQINNGADDDGSGTVTLLELAEAFAQAKAEGFGPRRSILFLNLTGEEKGLLGSEYYVDFEPVLPLDKTVTNLNIDMIGRYDPTYPGQDSNYVYIIGSKLISEELHEINQRVNEITGTQLVLDERFNSKDDPNQFYARSDHWNFGKPPHEIPFIFFFTGTHDDYHRPSDEAHKLDYERMASIARLIFATAWQVANQDAPPLVSGAGFH